MTKTILKFFKPHGPYVKGDIAGFDPVKATKLKSVARPYDAEAEKNLATVTLNMDTTEVQALIADAEAEFASKAADLEAREAALAAREAALAANADAAFETVPKNTATDTAADLAPEDAKLEDAKDKKAGKGEPPVQGGADAAAKK